MKVIPGESRENLHVAAWARIGDPTSYDVYIGLSDTDTEEPTEWIQGGWLEETYNVNADGQYRQAWVAYVLFSGSGNGGDLQADAGDYWVWISMTDATQNVKRPVEKIAVT